MNFACVCKHHSNHHRVHTTKKCGSDSSSKSGKKSKHSSKSSKKPKKTKSVSKSTSTKKVTSHRLTSTAHQKPKPTSTPRPTSSKKENPPPASKTSSKASIPAATQDSPSSSLSQLAKDSLDIHNTLRSKHKVPALSWSNELASAAQAWTDKCAYGHGGGKAIDAGENIAAYFGTGSDVAGAIGMWSDEAKDYNWGAPAYNGTTGHFTQQVWKSTTEIGCAQTLCPTLTFTYQAPWTNAYYYACEYKNAGNIVGNTLEATAEYFRENVLQ
ncbi:hypothetical protein JCM5353_001610 [Sporobolomyces roseus]